MNKDLSEVIQIMKDKQLLKKGGFYSQLYNSQFEEEA